MKQRACLIGRALIPAVLLWIPLIIVGFVFDAKWPNGEVIDRGWQDFIAFVVIITFLWTKGWLILRRMPYIDWLSLSLAASNFVFCAIYTTWLGFILWPSIVQDYPKEQQWLLGGLRTTLILVLSWSIILLVNIPDPERDRE